MKVDVADPRPRKTREAQFWLEKSDTRDSWFGAKQANPFKYQNDDPNVPPELKASKVKNKYLQEKIPGKLVAQRNAQIAELEAKRENQAEVLSKTSRSRTTVTGVTGHSRPCSP